MSENNDVPVIRKSMLVSRSLALRGLFPPHNIFGTVFWGCFLPPDRVGCAQQVLEEVLVAFGGVTNEVRSPQGENPWEVDGVVGVFHGELEAATFEFINNVCGDGFPLLGLDRKCQEGCGQTRGALVSSRGVELEQDSLQ